MSALLGIDIDVAPTPAAAMAEADVLITTTPATEALVHAADLHPGLHITAVGSDTEHKRELATDVLAAADRVVVDRRSQSEVLGELRAAIDEGFDAGGVVELGDVIAGRAPGRSSAEDVTVCDLTGTGAQDTAIATLAVRRCQDAGAGMRIAT